MKSKVFTLMVILFVLAVSFSACEAGKKIKPIQPDDDVVAFFERHLRECFFSKEQCDLCIVINSIDEFRDFFHCSYALPAIDFESYTLIIGKHITSTPSPY